MAAWLPEPIATAVRLLWSDLLMTPRPTSGRHEERAGALRAPEGPKGAQWSE
jgi:hypothetical protein